MSPTSISLTIPLADAQRNPRAGQKAADLSRVIGARFAVPKGFVLSADAYRSHLWSSGAREIAASAIEAEERVEVRSAILGHEIPEDIWDAVAEAYKRLSWQIGFDEPRVVVRSSAMEGAPAQGGFPGAYDSYLNVRGLEELKVAVKRVWASVWGGKAAAYRARLGMSAEPAMAVIVQQVIDADCAGTACTANAVTGNPLKVLVSCTSAGSAETERFEVDLQDLTAGQGLAQMVAEKAVMIEEVFGSRVEVEWALEAGTFWILQAQSMTNLPEYFPTDWTDDAQGKLDWHRMTSQPVCHFSRSHLWKSPRSFASPFPGRSRVDESRSINGYIYGRRGKIIDPKGRTENAKAREKELAAGFQMLAQWEKKIQPDLHARSARIIGLNPNEADSTMLIEALTEAGELCLIAGEWLDHTWYPSARFPRLLRDFLGSGTESESLYQRLVAGVSDGTVMRDARLQELGERFAMAERSGKVDDGEWWRSYKREVELTAREYGYAFENTGEMCDIAGWKSWIEDADAVFRIIGALARRDNRPTLVTLHCAKESAAGDAVSEAKAMFGGRALAYFEELLCLTRGWLPKRNEAEHAYALTCSALRLVLMEIAGRMCAAGLISEREDVFHLGMDEISALPIQPDPARRAQLAATIAHRKHDLWLERRLRAPAMLPINDAQAKLDAARGANGRLRGSAASPGSATGRVRIARSVAEAGEIENGDILIVGASKLAWTPFFALAGAVVSENGCDCSSEAILAREYGLPAVMRCRGILEAVVDGQRITVNGSEGTVELRS